MMNRTSSWIRAGSVLLAGTIIVGGLWGCSTEEEEPAPVTRRVAPPPPPPPPPPSAVPVTDLMAQLNIDSRIEMLESDAPATTEDRKAVLGFFDAFARGDMESVASMVDFMDRMRLEEIAESDRWQGSLENIESIELRAGNGRLGKCVLAIFSVSGDYDMFQLQLWEYESDGAAYAFQSVASPPDMIDRLAGADWIGAWYDILDEEIALANELDEEVELVRTVTPDAQTGDTGTVSFGDGPTPGNPNGPATPAPPSLPGRRNPSGPPRKAPGPG